MSSSVCKISYDAKENHWGLTFPFLSISGLQFLFRTWLSEPGRAGAAVKHALEVGYRHIDCAHLYKNEGEIGKYLTEVCNSGTIKREDVYIVSKLW